jgi:Zn2+/Cd2+-exporting ATPase
LEEKMGTISYWFHNVAQRRKLLTLTSGALILAGLISVWIFESMNTRDIFMVGAAVLAGSDIAGRAYASLRNRHFSIELLVTIAAAGAVLIGNYWEAAAVTFLFIFGAFLEARTLSGTRRVLQELLDLAPATAVVWRDGRQVEVLAEDVSVDEIVWVKPGSKVPVDGDVIEGRSSVDESAITGEPMPEEKTPGMQVYAGTVNQSGLLKVRVRGAGEDTTLARVIQRVEQAQEEKAPVQRFIERFAAWYTPAIILLSLLVFILSRDIELSLTLLVVACPGALVISTPVSVVAGIGRAARSGILIKGGEYLENSGKISAVALDKTGTLTLGKPRLTEIFALQPVLAGSVKALEAHPTPGSLGSISGEGFIPTNGLNAQDWDFSQVEVLRWAAIAEAGSDHPLARAILAESREVLGETPAADGFEYRVGKGIVADYQGRRIAVGTGLLMEELGIETGDTVGEQLMELQSGARTAVILALDGQVIGLLGISDPIRKDSSRMVRKLRENGIERIVMLTGDDRVTAEAIAAEAGITEVYAGLLPDDKLAHVQRLQREGHVVGMIGDGINDAPALAVADLGVAMGAAGSDIAIETADIALMADDLMKVPEAIRISKASLRNIRQNLVLALLTVGILLGGVLLGRVHMAGGMLIHEASVLIVILNGMRLLRI